MGSADDVVRWARSQIGQTDGSVYSRLGMGYTSYADWCAFFVSAGLKATGTECPYFPNGFAFDKRDLAKIGDRWREPYDLHPGYPIAFDFDGGGQWGGDHVGFVVERVAAGDYWTVEGNCGGQVRLKRRTVRGDGIIGGIAPRFASGASKAAAAPGKLLVDGVFGPLTCKALQEALQARGFYRGYNVDGVFGYYTKVELQKYLRKQGYYSGYALDGDFAYYSVRALQQHLRNLGYFKSSLRLDGKWGYWTTCGLQQALNDGKF